MNIMYTTDIIFYVPGPGPLPSPPTHGHDIPQTSGRRSYMQCAVGWGGRGALYREHIIADASKQVVCRCYTALCVNVVCRWRRYICKSIL